MLGSPRVINPDVPGVRGVLGVKRGREPIRWALNEGFAERYSCKLSGTRRLGHGSRCVLVISDVLRSSGLGRIRRGEISANVMGDEGFVKEDDATSASWRRKVDLSMTIQKTRVASLANEEKKEEKKAAAHAKR